MTGVRLAAEAELIAQRRPTYRTGGTGADGTCDCIGLVMGALYALGHCAYPMHSSNYFARFQTVELTALTSASQLAPGMIVFKARADSGGLHSRYRPGGRYHTGDLSDYYHAGLVLRVQPLCIMHCTSGSVSGIVYDCEAAPWTHCAQVRGVRYETNQKGEKPMNEPAVVTAPDGGTVNLRSRPSLQGTVLARLAHGTQVTVHESAQGWAQVTANGRTGYMMTQYLTGVPGFEEQVLAKLDAILQALGVEKA